MTDDTGNERSSCVLILLIRLAAADDELAVVKVIFDDSLLTAS